MSEQILTYAQSINANSEVLNWLQTTGKKVLSKREAAAHDLEHILDFLVSDAAPKRLQKMSFNDAKRKAKEWAERSQKKGRNLSDGPEDIETVHDFLDGTKIVRLLTKKALQREGFLMAHCVGGYSPSDSQHIYSYRDSKNMPHATFEVQRQAGEIVQIKGKGNGSIHPKYVHPILAFLKTIGLNIRPHDMRNLGYHHVPKEHLQFLKEYDLGAKELIMINGEVYAF